MDVDHMWILRKLYDNIFTLVVLIIGGSQGCRMLLNVRKYAGADSEQRIANIERIALTDP